MSDFVSFDEALDKLQVDAEELKRVCKGKPKALIIGAGHNGAAELLPEGEQFLRERGIEFKVLPSPEAASAYNACPDRKALLLHVTC